MIILIQMIGIVAWILTTISYWQKKKINLIILQLLGYILFSIHFLFLDGLSGALCNIAGVIIIFLLYLKEKTQKEYYWILFLIVLIYFIIGLISYDGLYTLLPSAACVVSFMANWQKKLLVIRIGGIIGSMCWLVYGFYVFSYATIISEVIFIISTALAIHKNSNNQKGSVT